MKRKEIARARRGRHRCDSETRLNKYPGFILLIYSIISIHQINGRHQYKKSNKKLNQENNHVIQYKVVHKAIRIHWRTRESKPCTP